MEENRANDEPSAPGAAEELADPSRTPQGTQTENSAGEEDTAQGEAIELLYAECPAKFYVRNRHLARYGEQIREACETHVKRRARRETLRDKMIYLARSGDNWRRVLILSIGTIQCHVRMVDSGHTEQVYIQDLYKLSSKVTRCKPAVLRCAIYDVASLPVCFADDSFLQIIDAVFQRSRTTPKMYRIDVKQDEPILYVDVLCEPYNTTSVVSLRDILLYYGVCANIPPRFPSADRSQAVTTLSKILAEANARDTVRIPTAPLPVGSVCNGTIEYAYGPDSFYVQPLGWADSNVRHRQSMLQYYLRGPPDMVVKMPHVGMLCAIRVHHRNMQNHPAWYRGRISTVDTQVPYGGFCNVIFIDSGRPGSVRKDNIFTLAERFQNIPAKVVHCKLALVAPITGDRYGTLVDNMFQALCTSDEQYKVRFVDREQDQYSVTVKMLSEPARCLSKELVQKKCAVFVSPEQHPLPADAPDGERSSGPVTMYTYPVLPIPDTMHGFSCTVIHYDEPFLLVVVPSMGGDIKQQLKQLMPSPDDLVPMAVVKQHDPCIVYDAAIGLLRGYITEYDPGMLHATVLLVDTHYTEIVPVSVLYQCPSEVRNMPLPYVTIRAPQYSFMTDEDDYGRIESIKQTLYNKYRLNPFYAKILNRSERLLEIELYTDETCEVLFLSRLLVDGLLTRIPRQPSGDNEPAGDGEEKNE